MRPPGTGEDRGARGGRDERRERRCDGREHAQQLPELVPRRRDRGRLEDQQREHQEADEGEDDVALGHTMHARRSQHRPAEYRDDDGDQHRDGEDIEDPRIGGRVGEWQLPADDAAEQQVGAAPGDHEEAPEDERVTDAADVVRALQQLALSEVDDDLVAQATPRLIDARFVATKSKQAVQTEHAVAEHGRRRDREDQEHDRPDALSRRAHSFRISSAMTRFMISLVPS